MARFQYWFLCGIFLNVLVVFSACSHPDAASDKGRDGPLTLTLSLSLDAGGSTPETSMARTIAPQPGTVTEFKVEIRDNGTLVVSGNTTNVTNNKAEKLALDVKVLKNNLTLTVKAYDSSGKELAGASRTIGEADLLSTAPLNLVLTNTSDGKSSIKLPMRFADGAKTKDINKFTVERWRTSDNTLLEGPTTFPLKPPNAGYREADIVFENITPEPLFLVMRFYRSSPPTVPVAVFLESVIVYQGFVSNTWIDRTGNVANVLTFTEDDFPGMDTGIDINDAYGTPLVFDNSRTAYIKFEDDINVTLGTIKIKPLTDGGSFEVSLGGTDITGDFQEENPGDRVYTYKGSNPSFPANSSILITSIAEDGLTKTVYKVEQAFFSIDSSGSGGPFYYYRTLQEAINTVRARESGYITAYEQDTTLSAITIEDGRRIFLNAEYNETVVLTRGTGVTGDLITVSEGTLSIRRQGSGTLTIDGGSREVNGSLVRVTKGSTFTLSGVTLQNNRNTGNGGGVYVDQSTFTMNGGTISGNTANSGGGVYLGSGASMTMENLATITENVNKISCGGAGVYLDGASSSLTTYSKGSINGNKTTAQQYPQVFNASGGKITVASNDQGSGW